MTSAVSTPSVAPLRPSSTCTAIGYSTLRLPLRRATHSLDRLTWNGEVECEKPDRRFYFEDTVLIEDTWNPEFETCRGVSCARGIHWAPRDRDAGGTQLRQEASSAQRRPPAMRAPRTIGTRNVNSADPHGESIQALIAHSGRSCFSRNASAISAQPCSIATHTSARAPEPGRAISKTPKAIESRPLRINHHSPSISLRS